MDSCVWTKLWQRNRKPDIKWLTAQSKCIYWLEWLLKEATSKRHSLSTVVCEKHLMEHSPISCTSLEKASSFHEGVFFGSNITSKWNLQNYTSCLNFLLRLPENMYCRNHKQVAPEFHSSDHPYQAVTSSCDLESTITQIIDFNCSPIHFSILPYSISILFFMYMINSCIVLQVGTLFTYRLMSKYLF